MTPQPQPPLTFFQTFIRFGSASATLPLQFGILFEIVVFMLALGQLFTPFQFHCAHFTTLWFLCYVGDFYHHPGFAEGGK